MNNKMITALSNQKILPLFFHPDAAVCLPVVRALYEAGIRVIEFTARGETALDTFTYLVETARKEMPDLCLGVGTIKNVAQAKSFIAAGAQFLISPGYVPDLAAYSSSEGLLYIPGCMTIQEIIAAENEGIGLVKLFPANLLGLPFLKNIKPLFPHMAFMPTGGIVANREVLLSWFEAGVMAVGLGNSLIGEQLLAEENYVELTARTEAVMDALKDE